MPSLRGVLFEVAVDTNRARCRFIQAVGIGRETAHAFAAEGAHVALADIDLEAAERSAEEIHKKDGSAQAFQLDVTHDKSAAACVPAVVNRFGRIDILVNSDVEDVFHPF